MTEWLALFPSLPQDWASQSLLPFAFPGKRIQRTAHLVLLFCCLAKAKKSLQLARTEEQEGGGGGGGGGEESVSPDWHEQALSPAAGGPFACFCAPSHPPADVPPRSDGPAEPCM